MYWGEVSEYDKSWREYAERNPNVDIMFFKFEDFLKNKGWVVKCKTCCHCIEICMQKPKERGTNT